MLCTALILSLTFAPLTDVALAFSGSGAGTELDPYIITTCVQLQEMEDDLDAYYELGNNIDCSDTVNWNSGAGFDPVGTNLSEFSGSLDGNDYLISDLTIMRANDTPEDWGAPEDEEFVGLFGDIEDPAVIQNVHIRDSKIKGYQYVGGITGYMSSGTISNVSVNTTTADNSCVSGDCVWARYGAYGGGIVGWLNGGSISNAITGGPVKGSGSYIGGLVGEMNGGTLTDSSSSSDVDGGTGIGGAVGSLDDGTVNRVFVSGDVTAAYDEGSGKSGRNAGGFVGTAYGGTISDAYATGDITADYGGAGGFAGRISGLQVHRAYSSGSVEVTGSESGFGEEAGGFVGAVSDDEESIFDSFTTSSVSSLETEAGFAGYHYPDGVATNLLDNVYFDQTQTDQSICYNRSAEGSVEGEFSTPRGVALDSEGNFYVSSSGDGRIQKFDSDGTFITEWGSIGTGNGEFELGGPTGLAVDSSGNVYAVDPNNSRIQKFDSDGTFITAWGSGGSGNGEFSGPSYVAVDSSDNVYVTDTYNNRIQKFDSDGNYIAQWGSSGSGNGQFTSPQGIVVDSSNRVYVGDAGNSRIQKFNSGGAYITQWGSAGTGDNEFETSSGSFGLGVDGDSNIYALDSGNYSIKRFSSTGTFIDKWGSQGTGEGEFEYSSAIAVDEAGNSYLADDNNHRVQAFNTSGVFQFEIGGPRTGSLGCTAVNTNGNDDDYFFDYNNEPFTSGGTRVWSDTVWSFSGTALPTLCGDGDCESTLPPNGDYDGDGTPNGEESSSPNDGDANDDGTPDYEQANVASFTSPITDEYVTLEVDETCDIVDASMNRESTNDVADSRFSYPNGFMNFTIDCDEIGFTSTIRQLYHNVDFPSFELRKYDDQDTYTTVTGAAIQQTTTGGGLNYVQAIYDVTDGGELDLDGLADSSITDPVGLGVDVGGELVDTGLSPNHYLSVGAGLMGSAFALGLDARRRRNQG